MKLGITDEWEVQMVDSTSIRGHSQAAGARGSPKEGFGRRRGGFTSKVHALSDRRGRPLAFDVTGGEASDSKRLPLLLTIPLPIPAPKAVVADAGYDGDANRSDLLTRGIRPVIKCNPTRKTNIPLDENLYAERNQIERMFKKLKQMRRIATRYDKTLCSF